MANEAGNDAEAVGQFTVVLDSTGVKKIVVIKVIRELTGLGLKEAKTITDNPPQVVLVTGLADAEDAVQQLEKAGAKARMTLDGTPVVNPLAANAGAARSLFRCPHCRSLSSGTRCENCGAPLS